MSQPVRDLLRSWLAAVAALARALPRLSRRFGCGIAVLALVAAMPWTKAPCPDGGSAACPCCDHDDDAAGSQDEVSRPACCAAEAKDTAPAPAGTLEPTSASAVAAVPPPAGRIFVVPGPAAPPVRPRGPPPRRSRPLYVRHRSWLL